MPNQIQWEPGTFTELISGTASAGSSMTSLAAGANVVSGLPVSDNRNLYGDFELNVRAPSGFAANQHVEMTFLMAPDGTNYEDGNGAVDPQKAPDVIFPVRATVTTQQKMVIRNVLLPVGKWKILVNNTADAAFSGVDNENKINYRPFNPEVQ